MSRDPRRMNTNGRRPKRPATKGRFQKQMTAAVHASPLPVFDYASLKLPLPSPLSSISAQILAGDVRTGVLHCHRATPGRWGHTKFAAKQSGEMRLVAKSARERELGERRSRRNQHLAYTLDAPRGDIVTGTNTDADFERSKQSAFAHIDETRE